ncbi:MAG: glycosyltransferase [Cytophagaceae bacterium]
MELFLFYLFLLCIYIHLFYCLFVFARIIFYEENSPLQENDLSVSVVVCAHNEYLNLVNLIPALLKQKYSNFEIIIVNDRSSDETERLSREFSSNEKISFLTISETPKGINPKKHALTLGVQAASKEIILLTDADCLPLSSKWINNMVQGFSSGKEIVLGICQYKQEPGLLNKLIRFETLYTAIQYISFALKNQAYMGVGRNMAYRKSLFDKLNGISAHKEITGGDDDLFIRDASKKGNVAIRINRKSQTISIPKKNYTSWFRQKKRHLSVGKYYKTRDKVRLGMLNISHMLFYISFFLLLSLYTDTLLIISLFLLRTGILITIFALISYKMKDRIKWYWIPILDFMYVINYLITGMAALFAKKIKWT